MNNEINEIKKAKKLFVEQLANKNQFIIHYENGLAFQSYRSLIAVLSGDTLLINWNKWDYSKTTLKHLKMFVNEYTPYTYENRQQFLKEIRSNEMIKTFIDLY